MNIFKFFELLSQAHTVLAAMQSDGTLTKLHDAIELVEKEAQDPTIKGFIAQVRGFIK